MIPETSHLFRVPLLDPKQHAIGYKLAWQKGGEASGIPAEAEAHLVALVAAGVGEITSGLLFVDANPAALSAETLAGMLPETTVWILTPGDLANADDLRLAASLREQGFGLALRGANLAFLKANEGRLSSLTHVLIDFDHPDLVALLGYARLRTPSLSAVVEKIPDWQVFDSCAALGASGFFEKLCVAPRAIKPQEQLGPQAQQILQLMQMVQGDADIRHVEKVLKSDVTLSYKLLRYINSAGFGLEVRIESPRHAVSMLGYAPLFRWLLLLLARTHTTGFSPALMQAAMIRGRFAELLGQGFLSRREAENLFVVGMFSFLDRLLGIPIQKVLSQLMLPEAVEQALRSRDGVYGPVLALAEACEWEDGRTADLAKALSMTVTHVNQAHLSALVWAQNIKL